MYKQIESQAIDAIFEGIKELGVEVPKEELTLEYPPNAQMGDIASTASFNLARLLKKSPNLISEDLAKVIKCPELFNKVESKGPYVNFFIDYSKFAKLLLNSIENNYGELSKVDEKIVLEHTSANPNGPLHIGHIRNSIIGDSLSRLLKLSGRDVHTEYYVNDMGRQIAMIVWGMTELGLKLENQEAEKIDHKIGQLYFKVNEKIREDESLGSHVDKVIKQYENAPSELDTIFEGAVNDCLSGVKSTLERLNIIHDEFVWEGQFVRNGTVDKITDELYEIGYARQGEVLYLDLTEFGVEKELVLRRADGTSLYSTRDIAYHMHKFTQGDIVLDVLGSDHKLAAKQVGLALEILETIEPQSDKFEVIFYEFIDLPEGSMSTRRGVFVSVDELINEAVNRAKEEITSRRPDLTQDEIDGIAEEIGIGAIRYYIARLSPEKPITFKWDEALSFERGCASIQYAHARACRLLDKSSKDINNLVIEDNWELNDLEKDLIRNLTKFPKLVKESADARKVHPIAQYCQDLAGAFNRFYKSEQVIGSDVENARLVLVNKTKTVLKNALDILGVSAPEKM